MKEMDFFFAEMIKQRLMKNYLRQGCINISKFKFLEIFCSSNILRKIFIWQHFFVFWFTILNFFEIGERRNIFFVSAIKQERKWNNVRRKDKNDFSREKMQRRRLIERVMSTCTRVAYESWSWSLLHNLSSFFQ